MLLFSCFPYLYLLTRFFLFTRPFFLIRHLSLGDSGDEDQECAAATKANPGGSRQPTHMAFHIIQAQHSTTVVVVMAFVFLLHTPAQLVLDHLKHTQRNRTHLTHPYDCIW